MVRRLIRQLRAVTAAAGLALAVAAVASPAGGVPSGRFGGTDVPYEKLGGPHHVSLTVAGSAVSHISVGAGAVFCHVNGVPGEGDRTVSFGAISGLPATQLYTEHFTNGEKAYEYDVTFVRTKPGAAWTTSKSAVLEPGPLYVIIYGSTQPGSSTFSQPSDGLEIEYGATAKGVFNGSGPDECYAQGNLTMRLAGA